MAETTGGPGPDDDLGGAARRLKAVRWGVPLVSVVLFVLSLPLPAFTAHNTFSHLEAPQTYIGFWLMAVGWLGLITGWFGTIWFATPLLWVGMLFVYVGRWRSAMAVNAVSAGLAAALLWADTYHLPMDPPPDFVYHVDRLGPGYWLWLAAIVVATAGSLVGYVLDLGARDPSA